VVSFRLRLLYPSETVAGSVSAYLIAAETLEPRFPGLQVVALHCTD
jgi:hypothetical protein